MGKTILIVDDEEGIRDVMKLTLEVEGFEVETAPDGKEGLKVLHEGPKPCLIFVDMMMPVMDGWEFTRNVRKEPGLAGVPVVAMTAFSDQSKVTDVDEILSKPVDLQKLYGILNRHCHGE